MLIKVIVFPLVSTQRHEDMAQALAFAYGKLRGGNAKKNNRLHRACTAGARHLQGIAWHF